MAKIGDLIQIKTGYANFVELKTSFEEDQQNLERMARYRPTKAHRHAFERICRGLMSPTDKKFYMLTGSYGTGKSHLCLMLANFLSRSSGDPELAGFYDNYEKLDPDQGRNLRNLRKGGQYLVAICDYNSGRNFEDVVLKAVIEACEAKEIASLVQTQHDEAERLLSAWEEKSGDASAVTNFYANFIRALEKTAPSLTIEQLREGLGDYDSNMLQAFKKTYREAQGGIEFQAQAGNIIPIIKKLVKSEGFKSRFKGLAILFDEFGFTLENAAYSKDILQGFMEKLCQNEPNILFVGCIHKNFEAYADRFSKTDAAVMSARITHVNLLNEGIEEIIGAIVEIDKTSPLWKSEVEPKLGVLDNMLPVCETLQLFPWIKETQRIRQRVLEDIYGVHPMALACLLKLSAEIGSNARSTFTFFTGDVDNTKGSYADFIQNADLTVNGGKLNLYTVAGLHTFFGKELDPKTGELRDTQRQLVNGFMSSEFTFRKSQQAAGELFATDDDARILILKIILLYQLCKIPAISDNIFFGLYGLKSDKKAFDKHIKQLVKVGALFFRKQSKTYELAAASSEDPQDLIDRYLDEPDKHPDDMVSALLEEAGTRKSLQFLEAKQYNLAYTEDKRFRRVFKQAKDLGPELWQSLLEDKKEAAGNCKNSYEGIAVYALCEDETDIKVAKAAVSTIDDLSILLSVPHEPQPFGETLLKVKACRHYLRAGEAEKLNPQTESRFRDLFENTDDGFLPALKNIMGQILSGDASCWYGKEHRVVVDMPQQSHKPADLVCEELYTRRGKIRHSDLNLVHDDRWKKGKNAALKQAVNMLLRGENVQIDNGNPDSHGEKKYLEKILLRKAGALKKIRSEGNVVIFECERNADKISNDYPLLKELCRRLNTLEAGETLSLGLFIKEAKVAPWGVGETSLMLSIAQVVAAFGERLRVYKDTTAMVEETLEDYGKLEKVLSDPAPTLVFEIKDISAEQEMLVAKVAAAVHAKDLLHGEKRSLTAACDALKSWWKNLPVIAKVKEIYEAADRPRIESFSKQFHKLDQFDRYETLFKIIPAIYDEEPISEVDSAEKTGGIVSLFEGDVKLLEAGFNRARNQVAAAIGKVFGQPGDMVQCVKTVQEWFEKLNPDQRDVTKYDAEPDAQGFISKMADPSVAYEKKLMETIPKVYGLDAVEDWPKLRTDDYVNKLTQVKADVESAAVIVPAPEIRGKEKFKQVKDYQWEIDEGGSMGIAMAEGISSVVYTLDGTDPRSSETCQKATKEVILKDVLASKSGIKVMARAIDDSGNYSDLVTCSVINKKKEFEVNVGSDDLFSRKGTFKIPDSIEALKAVLGSTVDQARKDSLINEAQAQKLKDSFNEL